jgi:hypothetical protein
METNTNYWGEFFLHWPVDLARRGIIVTSFNEQISFSSFSTSGNFLLLERQTPDSQGARSVIVPYNQVLALKIVDVTKPRQFKAAGFEELSSKS